MAFGLFDVFGDFASQPPELISIKIYSGPGSEPLTAAAAAWDGLAAELQSTASSYAAAISELGASWEGPSFDALSSAVAPYVSWLSTTASQAELAGSQARAAASAYESAFTATVSPAVIAANRAELASLITNNIFGQNNSAIEAVEAEYEQIWAEDVAAITNYASAASAATQLSAFTEAPATTSGTTAAAASTAAAVTPQTIVQQLEAILTQLTTATNTLTTNWSTLWENTITKITGNSSLSTLWETTYSFISNAGGEATYTNVVNSSSSLGIGQWKNFFVYQPWSANMAKSGLAGGLSSGGAPAHLARPVSAVLGASPTVGKLSVPASWANATPAIRLASTVLPGTSLGAAPLTGFPNLFNEAAAGSFAGGGLGTPMANVASRTTRVETHQNRPLAAKRKAPVSLDKVIAQLQEQPDVVQHWNVDEAGLDDLVAELSTKPGVHAVHVVADGAATVAAPVTQSG